MTKRRRNLVLALAGLSACLAVLVLTVNAWLVGRPLDSYRNVPVYGNGLFYFRSYGRHYASDGYYFGQKWQCVEFIKRFYFEAFGHRMPDVMGHAKDFFDPAIPHRGLNARRDMIQFVNGGDEPPAPDDLLVFRDTRFGHVAIVSAVNGDQVEVIQQNILGRTRQAFALSRENGAYSVTAPRSPAGWLRIRQASADKTIADLINELGVQDEGNDTCNTASAILVTKKDEHVPALRDALCNPNDRIRRYAVMLDVRRWMLSVESVRAVTSLSSSVPAL